MMKAGIITAIIGAILFFVGLWPFGLPLMIAGIVIMIIKKVQKEHNEDRP